MSAGQILLPNSHIHQAYRTFSLGICSASVDLFSVVPSDSVNQICDDVYEVLTDYVYGDGRKNELYLAKHIPFFQKQLGYVMK